MSEQIKKTNEGDYLAEIRHELNNILTSINLSSELLIQEVDGELNKKQKNYLRTIISESKRIEELVKKIR